MFQITVETRRATVEEKELLTSGSVGIQVQFAFSADWDGLSRTAVFRREDDEDYYGIVLDETNVSVIPWEILTDPDVTVYAGAFGENESGEIVIPTVWVTLGAVREGAHSGNSSSADPTPTQWSQILGLAESADQKAGAAQDIAQSVRDDADAGEFDGEPGPPGYTPQKGIDYFDGDPGPVGPAGIAVQSTAPSTDEKVWLDPDEDTSAVVPEIYATTDADVYNMGDEYLSAESVFDRTLGKTQEEINAIVPAYENPTRLTNIAGVSGVTIDENRTYQIGKLVIVNIRFTLSASIGANSTVVQGFPAPASSLSSASSIVALACTKTGIPFTMVGSGEVMPTVNATAQLYVVSGCYIAA